MSEDRPKEIAMSDLHEQDRADEALRAAWRLGDYVVSNCSHCGRARLCICDNGMHRCEKCNWCPELSEYAPTDV